MLAHVEVFARDRVVIIPAGVGVRGARTLDGRVVTARCYGQLVTLDPTGVVLTAAAAHATLAELFTAWGLPLSNRRLAGFEASGRTAVRCYVDGHRVLTPPAGVSLSPHAEIVLEVGPYVPPHSSYTFARALTPIAEAPH